MTHAEEKIIYDELKMLERSIMCDVKSAAETTFCGLDRDPLDMDETKELGMLVEHVANICYGNYNREDVYKARIKLIQELQYFLEYRIEERALLDTFGWMTAQELIEQGQPVEHPSIPGRKFYRYMGTIICEQDDGVKHEMSDAAAKAVLQALLPHGWRTA